jgi:4-hydroxybenzoate polyprenyltransferase
MPKRGVRPRNVTMHALLLLANGMHVAWYLLPLAVAVSLVYSATRFEYPPQILRRSARLFLTIMISMAAVFAVLCLLSWNL